MGQASKQGQQAEQQQQHSDILRALFVVRLLPLLLHSTGKKQNEPPERALEHWAFFLWRVSEEDMATYRPRFTACSFAAALSSSEGSLTSAM